VTRDSAEQPKNERYIPSSNHQRFYTKKASCAEETFLDIHYFGRSDPILPTLLSNKGHLLPDSDRVDANDSPTITALKLF